MSYPRDTRRKYIDVMAAKDKLEEHRYMFGKYPSQDEAERRASLHGEWLKQARQLSKLVYRDLERISK